MDAQNLILSAATAYDFTKNVPIIILTRDANGGVVRKRIAEKYTYLNGKIYVEEPNIVDADLNDVSYNRHVW